MPDANTVAGGAPYNDGNGSNSGHVRVYQWNGSSWQQKGVDINGESAQDGSGWSISMPDANTIGIGARWNDGSGTDAGHARVYRWNGSAWTMIGMDINGESPADFFGEAVSMPDINTIAIGGTLNDGGGTDAGHVRIFNDFPFALPVTLSAFRGELKPQSNLLEWITSSEQHNAFFNVQHSTDGFTFSTLAKISSQAQDGNSQTAINYTVEHQEPTSGHHYYRLEQVDLDGTATLLSQVIHLYRGHTGSTFAVYPNPASDVVYLDHFSATPAMVTVRILDCSGRLIKTAQSQGHAGNSRLKIPLGDLAQGLYMMQVFENGHLSDVSRLKKD